MTISAIESGELGEVEVSYNYPRRGEQKRQVQRTSLADLRGQNILGLVQDVLRLCHETGESVDGIDLSAMGQDAALVNDGQRIRAAMKGSLPFMNPWYLFARQDLMKKVVRGIISEGSSAPPNEPIIITTKDQKGMVVGRARWLVPLLFNTGFKWS